MSSGITSRNVSTGAPRLKKATRSGASRHEKDGKYSKIRESRERLVLRLGFAAVVLSIVAVVVIVTGRATGGGGGGRTSLRKNAVAATAERGVPASDRPNRDGRGEAGSNRNPASLQQLEQKRLELDRQVREVKATGVIMETDARSLKLTRALQDVTKQVLRAK